MAEDKKSNSGAPSTDTTSALFVSARKKQLEQQEAERRAKEKEEQRKAAEDEVRRLEKEVEDRRRKAEEDARKAEDEARRITQDAQARTAKAREEAQEADAKAPAPAKKERAAGSPLSKKVIIIAASAAAAVVVAIVVLALFKTEPYVSSSGFNILGTFYNEETHTDVLTFEADGSCTFVMGYQSEDQQTEACTYATEKDVIRIKTETYVDFEVGISNENKLLFVGNVFLRAPAGEVPPPVVAEVAPEVDRNANLDAFTSVNGLKMGFAYPSTQFEVKSQENDNVILASKDGLAYVQAYQFAPIKLTRANKVRASDMKGAMEQFLQAIRESIDGGIAVTRNEYDEKTTVGHIEATYNISGTTMFKLMLFSVFRNEQTKELFIFVMTLDSPVEQTVDYSYLLYRIFGSVTDVI